MGGGESKNVQGVREGVERGQYFGDNKCKQMEMSLEDQLLFHTSAPREMLMRSNWGLEGSPEPSSQMGQETLIPVQRTP